MMMKAVTYERYGGPEVLGFSERARPVPRSKQILLEVHATTVTTGDWRLRSMQVPAGFRLLSRLAFGVSGPRQQILGSEVAGVVVAVGSEVTKFAVGDALFAFNGATMGGYAEYVCVDESAAVAPVPEGLDFAQAAALSFGGSTALDFFRRAKLAADEDVLIVGASGGVGSAAVQIAKARGARVTAVCSGRNRDIVHALGAQEIIDYTQQDFTRCKQRFDIIMDTVGSASYPRSKHLLKPGGRLLQVLASMPDVLLAPWRSWRGEHRIIAGPAAERPEDIRTLGRMAAEGQYRPVIDRSYSWDEIVDAHRYVDAGHKRGNVVLWVRKPDAPRPAAAHGASA